MQWPRDLSSSLLHALSSSEVVWPEHTGRKWNCREMFLSTQALRHLTPSPSPMDLMEETEPTAHTDEPQKGQSVQNVKF